MRVGRIRRTPVPAGDEAGDHEVEVYDRLDGLGSGAAATGRLHRGTGALADAAREAWTRLDQKRRVLIHYDFWCGNALWDGGTLTGVVDWSGARHGPRGIDLA